MNFFNFDFYKLDIQAILIIISTMGLLLAANKFIIDDDEKRYNELIVSIGGVFIGFLISLLVSYVTLEADTIDTSDYYN